MRWLVLLLMLPCATMACGQDAANRSSLSSRPLYQSLQQALDTLSRAEIAAETAALTEFQAEQATDARKLCRQVIADLNSLEQKLAQLLRETYQTRPSQRANNSWSLRELESLDRNLKVQLARAYRNQALCYSPGSIDRLNSLSLALQQLPDVVTQPLDDASVWRARVEQVVCLRLINRPADAAEMLGKWQAESPPTAIVSRLRGEELLLALDEGNVTRAQQLAKQVLTASEQRSPETDDAVLQVLLAVQQSTEDGNATQNLRGALQHLQHITTTHGSFWQRRAEIRIGRALSAGLDSNDPELLTYAAASLYAVGKPQQAIAMYERIVKLYSEADDSDQVFQTGETIAAILRETGQNVESRDRYRALALNHTEHSRAAAVHLTAIGLSSELAQLSPTEQRADAFESYLELLREHIKHWPQSPSAQQAQQWLADTELPSIDRQRARTFASQGKTEQAQALYRDLIDDSPDDAQLHEEFADLLAKSTKNSDLREALRLRLQLEKRSKPGGPRWWRSRRARLALLKQLGEGEQAEKLKQLTEILYE